MLSLVFQGLPVSGPSRWFQLLKSYWNIIVSGCKMPEIVETWKQGNGDPIQ
jgi:hypothetical protein